MAHNDFHNTGSNAPPSLGRIIGQQSQFKAPDIFEPKLEFNPIPDFDPNSFVPQGRNAPPAAPSFQQAPQAPQAPAAPRQFDVAPQGLSPEEIGALPPLNIAPSPTEFEGGGLASREGAPTIGSSTPATGFQTFPTQGGGQVGIPSVLPDGRTAEDIQAGVVGQQAGALPGSQSEQERAALLVREAKQQQTIRESGSTSAGRKIAESLKEQGMSEEDINKAVEGSSSNFERFQKLNQLQKREALKRSSTKKVQGARDRLAQNARRDEDGGAKNKAAIAEDVDNFFQGFGADTESETPLFDQLNKSQKREVEKFLSDASRGASTDRQQRRMEQFKEDATIKDEKAFRKKLGDLAADKIKKGIADATSKAEGAWFTNLGKQLSAIEKRLKSGFTGKNKRDDKKRFEEMEIKLQDELSAGYVPESQTVAPVVTDEERKEAMDWLEKNPNDPNVPAVKARLGI